ncbi:MAG: 3'-5' exonuclease [bacterium]|nr:3'-5' exonuclease [bacterium]
MQDDPRYDRWDDVPPGLRPENDLRFAGLEPQGAPVARLVMGGREIALYREADAVPRAEKPARGTPRGAIDPSRSSDRPAGSAGTRATPGLLRDVVVLPGAGTLRRATVWTDADPSSGIQAALDWIRALLLDDFVVIDTETTGLGHGDEVIEIGLVGPDGATRFSSLVRPRSGRIPPRASAVHGITMDQLVDAPSFAEVYDAVLEHTHDRRVIAWNAPFDERLVRQSAVGWGRRERLRGFECAMRAYALARGLTHGRAKLARAAGETGVLDGRAQSHRSTDDALLTLRVLMRAAGGR